MTSAARRFFFGLRGMLACVGARCKRVYTRFCFGWHVMRAWAGLFRRCLEFLASFLELIYQGKVDQVGHIIVINC